MVVFSLIALLAAPLSSQAPASSSTPTPSPPSSWIDGPEAPSSTAPLPPSSAPRTPGSATELLVVPPVPPEDARVAVPDGLLVELPSLRAANGFSRSDRLGHAVLDVDSFADRALVPGVVFVPRGPGVAVPSARGHRNEVGVVVDGVPLLATSFTEAFSLLGDAQLTIARGPQASGLVGGLGGVIDVDSGGALDDVGASGRVDGALGAGYGGPDNEKGAFFLGRTGWKRLRVIGQGTVLQREDFRTGRLGLDVPPGVDRRALGSQIVAGSGGLGGTLGARVDVVPVADSRVFVSHHAGRSLDAGDPVSCGATDEGGGPVDCTRARERGVDVVVVGADVRRDVSGIAVQPQLRVHAQRMVNDTVRFGSGFPSVDTATDNVFRGGAVFGLAGRGALDAANAAAGFVDAAVAVSVVADRYDAQFFTRSLRVRDAEPALGISVPVSARFVDDTIARSATVAGHVAFDSEVVDVRVAGRVVGAAVDGDGVAANDVVPAGEAAARVVVVDGVVARAAVGHAARVTDASLVAARGVGSVAVDDFAEVGVDVDRGFVDVDVVAWGSVRTPPDTGVRAGTIGAVGVEADVGLRPGLQGLDVRLIGSAFVADDDRGPVSGVLQPQLGGVVTYAPPAWPVRFYVRGLGGLPHTRLSVDEAADRRLCPELPEDATLEQTLPCSGVAGFAVVDVGASLTLGQLRFDVAGENLTDTQGAWRGAVFGTGGTALRTRVAFVF